MKKTKGIKKVISLLLASALAVTLTACSSKKSTNNDSKTIKVGASPIPHKEILEKAKPILEKEGYKLEITEFTDYVVPNTALAEKEIDANFYQHIPFLNKTNKEKGYDLDYTVKVHIEPMGLYSKKITKLEEIKKGSEIAVPNDPSNEARALRLLEKHNLIKLKKGELVTPKDITENPQNIKITELDAAQLPRVLEDVQAAVINTNFALNAKLNPIKDAIIIEDKDSPYANVIAIRKKDKNSKKIKALSEALNSSEIKKFIGEKYKGSIVPAF